MKYFIALTFILGSSTAAFAQPETAEQKNRRIIAENQKIERENADIVRLMTAGDQAYAAKDCDTAIARYDEALKAAPAHPGLVAVLTNQSQAYRMRGAEKFLAAAKLADAAAKDVRQAAAKDDFRAALEAAGQALTLLENSKDDRLYATSREKALGARFRAMRVAVQQLTPKPSNAEVKTAFMEYIAVVNAAEQLAIRKQGGNMLFDVEMFAEAYPEFEKVLAATPNDVHVLFMAGMSAAMLEKNADAVRLMERYLTAAPADHRHRQSATEAMRYLKP